MFMRLLWNEMREGAKFREAGGGLGGGGLHHVRLASGIELGFELLCICLLSLWML